MISAFALVSSSVVRRLVTLSAILLLALLGAAPLVHAACPGPAPVTGQAVPSLASVESRIQAFMAAHQLPGGALAISKDGRLVYSRGFGYADTDTCDPVVPDALFRIASISKPFTAAAIMKLVEQGQLSLGAKLTDVIPSLAPVDPRWHDITIAQLLWHSGGWDRDISPHGDPMFRTRTAALFFGQPPPGSPQTVIDYMQGFSLDHAPGTYYAYSNLGYNLLGRVIEAVTGQTYADYVRSTILDPLGIVRMQIGHSLEPQRLPGEVHYYDYPGAPLVQSEFTSGVSLVPTPYGGMYVEGLDSGGGWVASAIDLLRFIDAADFRFWNPDLLQLPTLLTMLAAPPPPTAGGPPSALADPANICSGGGCTFHYGLGLDVYNVAGVPIGWGHGGSLPGTTTYVARMAEGTLVLPSGTLTLPAGVNMAVLFNSRPQNFDTLHAALVSEIAKGIAEATSWPSGDQFPPLCGNGVLNLGEGCDDANTAAGDGCSPECLLTAAAPVGTAGFGFVETDPNTGQYCGSFDFDVQDYDVFGTTVNLGSSVGSMGFTGQADAFGGFASQCTSVAPGLLSFDSAGDLVCPAAGCDSGGTVSFVGSVSNLAGSAASQLPSASYALEGGAEFTGVTTTHACLPGSQPVWSFDGRFGVNAFRAVDVPTGGFVRASSELRYYDSSVGSLRSLDVGVLFGSATSPGTLLVEGASNAAGGISSDFELDLAGYHAFFFDVSTTATYSGVVTVCVRYADADNDGLVDGTSVPEGALEILHRENGSFVKKTFTRLPAENLICAQVGHLSPFALVVSVADSDGDGTADVDDVCPRVADPGQADADADRVGDACDDCTSQANPDQIDSDQDGYGNRCDADYDNDGAVGLTDFGLFRGQFGGSVGSPGFEAAFDSDHNGAVGLADFGAFRLAFGNGVPGPSGLACAGSIPCSAP